MKTIYVDENRVREDGLLRVAARWQPGGQFPQGLRSGERVILDDAGDRFTGRMLLDPDTGEWLADHGLRSQSACPEATS